MGIIYVMLKFRKFVSFEFWRNLIKLYHLKGAFLVLIVFFSIFWQIGTYSSGISPSEEKQYQASSSFNQIVSNPVDAPLKTVELGFIKSGLEKPLAARLTSSLVACSFVLALYIVIKRLLGKFYAGMGVLLVMGIPLFQVLARSGSGSIAILVLLPLGLLIHDLTKRLSNPGSRHLALLSVIVAFFLYTPAAMWLAAPVALKNRKDIARVLKSSKNSRLMLAAVLLLVLLAPLLMAVITDFTQFREWLMLPSAWPGLNEILMRLLWFVPSVVFTSRDTGEFSVGSEPLIGIAILALVGTGLAATLMKGRELITRMLLIFSIGLVLYILNGRTEVLIALVPGLVILATMGIKYLFKEWKSVFPNNPIPKDFALVLISAVCILQAFFGYYVAHRVWPATDATKRLYVIK